MKKQSNLPAAGRKLSLNKKTISNLTATEMSGHVGGVSMTCTYGCTRPHYYTCNGKTCNRQCI